jgi:hypothetical protein
MGDATESMGDATESMGDATQSQLILVGMFELRPTLPANAGPAGKGERHE